MIIIYSNQTIRSNCHFTEQIFQTVLVSSITNIIIIIIRFSIRVVGNIHWNITLISSLTYTWNITVTFVALTLFYGYCLKLFVRRPRNSFPSLFKETSLFLRWYPFRVTFLKLRDSVDRWEFLEVLNDPIYRLLPTMSGVEYHSNTSEVKRFGEKPVSRHVSIENKW